MGTSTRERIVDASAILLRRQGYAATGVKQIVAEAEAPFSSLYHFFPGGKDELTAAAIRSSGRTYFGLALSVVVPTNSMIAFFVAPSFQDGNGSTLSA